MPDAPPYLWGPPTWDALFFLALKCDSDDYEKLHTLVFDYLRELLPCGACLANAPTTYKKALGQWSSKRGRRTPRQGEDMFEFLFYLKKAVNAETNRASPVTLKEVTERYVFHQHFDEVRFADALVLYAFAHEQDKLARFAEMLLLLHELLPENYVLKEALAPKKMVRHGVVAGVLRAALHTRAVYGQPLCYDKVDGILRHYRRFISG